MKLVPYCEQRMTEQCLQCVEQRYPKSGVRIPRVIGSRLPARELDVYVERSVDSAFVAAPAA